MPTDLQQASLDLAAKLTLESGFRPEVVRAQTRTVEEFVASLTRIGQIPDIRSIEAAEFEPVLRRQYDRVAAIFDHRTNDRLPNDVKLTPQERLEIAAVLTLLFQRRAKAQSERIAKTSAANARRSLVLANADAAEIARKTGVALTRAEIALNAGTLFARSQRGRTSGIVITETQKSSEQSKAEESRVLIQQTGKAHKTWYTRQDDLVRDTPAGGHRAPHVHGQRRLIDKPYNVGGQLLMEPGDQSLGATIDNVANCRCSSVTDAQEVAERRAAERTTAAQPMRVAAPDVTPARTFPRRRPGEPGPDIGRGPRPATVTERVKPKPRVTEEPTVDMAVINRDMDAMYKKAPIAKAEIDALADRIIGTTGGSVAKAPIKGRKRATEKAVRETKKGGSAANVGDLARNTIVVDTNEVNRALGMVRVHPGAKVKIVDPALDPLGYSGSNIKIKTRSGITAEVQVNTPEMIFAKEVPETARIILGEQRYADIASKTGVQGGKGHTFYEEYRSLPPGNPRLAELESESRAYYDHIRATGR